MKPSPIESHASALLGFSTQVLAACCEAKPPVKSNDPMAFWSMPIPGALKLVPHIIQFGRRDGVFEINVAGFASVAAWIEGQPEYTAEGLKVSYRYRLDGHEKSELRSMVIPWPNPATRQLFSGEWSHFGFASIRINPASLIPNIKPLGDGVLVEWADPPVIRYEKKGFLGWLFNRFLTASVKSVLITPFDGEITAPGLMGKVLPRLVWG